jgi:hypothetical protein
MEEYMNLSPGEIIGLVILVSIVLVALTYNPQNRELRKIFAGFPLPPPPSVEELNREDAQALYGICKELVNDLGESPDESTPEVDQFIHSVLSQSHEKTVPVLHLSRKPIDFHDARLSGHHVGHLNGHKK